ncbi:MAG: hypothetical protein PHC71_04180 [Candidatus Omnitrophica bacterium]|nr:hypothetical protein [Candidatus Omnitrophota bacterium]
MSLEEKGITTQKLKVIFVIFLVLSLANIVSLLSRGKHMKELTVKVNQQSLIIEEKDKQIETDKVQYTSLAARLHKEIKKVGELETELKKYRR